MLHAHECVCFIEFIKRAEEKRLNARLAEHVISLILHGCLCFIEFMNRAEEKI